MKKYGTNLDREDLTFLDWVNHAQEEHMDAILYLEKIRKIENKRLSQTSSETKSWVAVFNFVLGFAFAVLYNTVISSFLGKKSGFY